VSPLIRAQHKFLIDVSKLIIWANTRDWVLTGGELFRTVEQQRIHVKAGRSRTMNSQHGMRLAIDFNIFVDGQLCYDKKVLAPMGAFWESMDPLNSWGGNGIKLVDTPHFSRGIDKPEFRRVT
jgi:hypothetical protein